MREPNLGPTLDTQPCKRHWQFEGSYKLNLLPRSYRMYADFAMREKRVEEAFDFAQQSWDYPKCYKHQPVDFGCALLPRFYKS